MGQIDRCRHRLGRGNSVGSRKLYVYIASSEKIENATQRCVMRVIAGDAGRQHGEMIQHYRYWQPLEQRHQLHDRRVRGVDLQVPTQGRETVGPAPQWLLDSA